MKPRLQGKTCTFHKGMFSLHWAYLCWRHIIQKNFNKADHTAREKARGWKQQGRRHTADGNQHLHLRDTRKIERRGSEKKGANEKGEQSLYPQKKKVNAFIFNSEVNSDCSVLDADKCWTRTLNWFLNLKANQNLCHVRPIGDLAKNFAAAFGNKMIEVSDESGLYNASQLEKH